MTEYWICSKEWRIWSYIPYSPSDTDEYQWQLTNLNAEFLKLIDKTRMWMTIWRNWTVDLNAVSFSGRNWIENWWNWMQRWRKWAGKPILYSVNKCQVCIDSFVLFTVMSKLWFLLLTAMTCILHRRIWDLFVVGGGGAQIVFARFARITNPCPNPWKSRSLSKGEDSCTLLLPAKLYIILSHYRGRGTRVIHRTEYIDKQKKKKRSRSNLWSKFPRICPHIAQICLSFARISIFYKT